MKPHMDMRLARLEGAYEQIDRRLADLRQELAERFGALEQRVGSVEQRLAGIELRMDDSFARVDQKFTWVVGIVVGTWITTILTILFHR